MKIRDAQGNVYEAPDGTPVPSGYVEIGPSSTGSSITAALGKAREAVGSGLRYIDRLGGIMPGSGNQGLVPTDMLNPVPANAGDVGSLVANVVANKVTGGAAGVGPALIRTGATVAGGAIPDYYIDNDPNAAINGALWRTVFSGGAEASAGVVGLLRRAFGATRLQPDDLKRVAEATSIPGRTVEPTLADVRQAGASKPRVGAPSATTLEGAAKIALNKADEVAANIASEKVKFDVPDLGRVNLRDALDRYRALAEGRMTTASGDQLVQAEKLWSQIMTRLQGSKLPELQIAANVLQQGRAQFGLDMSRQRVIDQPTTGTTVAGKNLEPAVNPSTSRMDMSAIQRRYLAGVDAGQIDEALQPELAAKLFRGGQQPGQPLTDQPGQFKPGLWVRGLLSGEGMPSIGFHPEQAAAIQFPRFVGTPENLGPVQPVQGAERSTLSLGATATANLLRDMRELLRGAP